MGWRGESLKKGAGAAHKYARKDFGLPPPNEQAMIEGVWQDDPVKVIDARSSNWAAFWARDKHKRARLGLALARLRLS